MIAARVWCQPQHRHHPRRPVRVRRLMGDVDDYLAGLPDDLSAPNWSGPPTSSRHTCRESSAHQLSMPCYTYRGVPVAGSFAPQTLPLSVQWCRSSWNSPPVSGYSHSSGGASVLRVVSGPFRRPPVCSISRMRLIDDRSAGLNRDHSSPTGTRIRVDAERAGPNAFNEAL